MNRGDRYRRLPAGPGPASQPSPSGRKAPSLPVSLLLLAIFTLGIGLLGVVFSFSSLFDFFSLLAPGEPLSSKEQIACVEVILSVIEDPGRLQADSLDETISKLPPNLREEYKRLFTRQDGGQAAQQALVLIASFLRSHHEIFQKAWAFLHGPDGPDLVAELFAIGPRWDLINFGNLLLSVLAVIAAVGFLTRKSWGLKFMVAFLVAETLFIAATGYFLFPLLLDIWATLLVMMGGKAAISASDFISLWTGLCILLAAGNALVIFYLLSSRVAKFFPPREV